MTPRDLAVECPELLAENSCSVQDSSATDGGSDTEDASSLNGVSQVPTLVRHWQGLHGIGAFSGPSDLIDREVQCICRRWPAILERNTVVMRAHGRYRINDRDVLIHIVMAEGDCEDRDEDNTEPETRKTAEDEVGTAGGEGSSTRASSVASAGAATSLSEDSGTTFQCIEPHDCVVVDVDSLVVRDGPLTQPFLDYVFDTGKKEQYDMPDSDLDFQGGKLQKAIASVELEYGELPYHPEDRVAAMSIAQIEVHMRETEKLRQLGKKPHPDEELSNDPLVDDDVLPEMPMWEDDADKDATFITSAPPQLSTRMAPSYRHGRATRRLLATQCGEPPTAATLRDPGRQDAGLIKGKDMKALLKARWSRDFATPQQDFATQKAMALLQLRQNLETPTPDPVVQAQTQAAIPDPVVLGIDFLPGMAALAIAVPPQPVEPPLPPQLELVPERRRRHLFGESIPPGTAGLPPFELEEEEEAHQQLQLEEVPSLEPLLPEGVVPQSPSKWRQVMGFPVDLPTSLQEDGLLQAECDLWV